VQEGPKYSPGTIVSLVYIIKKDRLSTFVLRDIIRVAAAVQFGIEVPPLHPYAPGSPNVRARRC